MAISMRWNFKHYVMTKTGWTMQDTFNPDSSGVYPYIPVDESQWEKLDKEYKRRQNRKEKDAIMKDMGLTKVRGPVSGKTYWE